MDRFSQCCRAVILALLTAASGAAELQVKIPHWQTASATHSAYVVRLLELALARSAAPGEVVRLVAVEHNYSQARLISELQRPAGQIDLLWTMTDQTREEVIWPVRIPLYKGLFGHRVFLIRASDQHRFDGVRQLHQLRQLRAGQGSQWPDTQVLRHSGLPVVTSVDFEKLFPMLRAGRFDYFPRAANEAWAELAAHPDEGLAVEKGLILVYPAPLYFFVGYHNPALHRRLEQGLNAMVADGSFDQFFYSHPVVRQALSQLSGSGRHRVTLENPYLPPATPLDDRRLWLQLDGAR